MIQSVAFHCRKCHFRSLVAPPGPPGHGPSSDDSGHSGHGHRAHPGQAPGQEGQDPGRVCRGVRGLGPDRKTGIQLHKYYEV